MIYDLVDIILLKHPHLKRETVQEILSTTTNVIIENVKKKLKQKKKPQTGQSFHTKLLVTN